MVDIPEWRGLLGGRILRFAVCPSVGYQSVVADLAIPLMPYV